MALRLLQRCSAVEVAIEGVATTEAVRTGEGPMEEDLTEEVEDFEEDK